MPVGALFLFLSNDIIPRQFWVIYSPEYYNSGFHFYIGQHFHIGNVKSDMTNLMENIKYQFIQIAGEVGQ